MSSDLDTVSLVVPAYNEQELLPGHLLRMLDYCATRPWRAEILVVDDGSTDATAELVSELAERHPEIRLLSSPENHGKGHAVRQGILAARGGVRGFTDADGSTPVDELDRLLTAIREGASVAIGSRARRDGARPVRAHLHRKLLGRAFNLVLRLLLGLVDRDGRPIADTQCGFKWFTAAAAEDIFRRSVEDGFAFDVEVLWLANRLELPIAEVPVEWADRGTTTVDLRRDPWRMLRAAARLRTRRSIDPVR